MFGSEFSFHDGVGELQESLRFWVSLEQVHAAAEVVVDGGCVNSVAAKSLLSDVSCLQVAPKGPSRLVNMVKD